MKKYFLITLALAVAFVMGFMLRPAILRLTDNNKPKAAEKVITSHGKVTGIGGIFFKCNDPVRLKEWYKEHLGFDTDEYGARFEFQRGTDTSEKVSIQWSVFAETNKYFDPSEKDFMINYTVSDLTGLVAQLKKEGVTVLDTIETYDYGKFAHIMDIDGNKIELYEPDYSYKQSN